MSFRQDRTNPASAVSNWKGRTSTPKAWPSTAVSTWQNGGLFGGGGIAGTAWEPIATSTFSAAGHTFSAIPQTYADLRVVLKTAVSGSSTAHIKMRVNGISYTSYHFRKAYQYVGSNVGHGASVGNAWDMGQEMYSTGLPYIAIADIIDYASGTAQPCMMSIYGETPSTDVWMNLVGFNTGELAEGIPAVTSLEISNNFTGSTYPSGSTVTLYGIGTAF
jgi:hypothetical protein